MGHHGFDEEGSGSDVLAFSPKFSMGWICLSIYAVSVCDLINLAC